ncbi:MAG: hypothetical protein H7Y30_14230 [Pyrinomonadaceae bacterium]|nr:hypothetical protein [Pyrinomonadaceae bacterium]
MTAKLSVYYLSLHTVSGRGATVQTREKGNITEAKILAALVDAGYLVSVPFGSGHKYDFIIDDLTNRYRVQCKTGRIRNGCLAFNSYSQSGNGSVRQSYYGLADLFAVLNPQTGEVYLVPVAEFGSTGVNLRLIPTLNGQAQKIHWAVDYLLTSLYRAS